MPLAGLANPMPNLSEAGCRDRGAPLFSGVGGGTLWAGEGAPAAAQARDAHRFELQEGLGGGEVLGEDLVDADADLLAGDQAALDEVGLEDLASEVLAHVRLAETIGRRARGRAGALP